MPDLLADIAEACEALTDTRRHFEPRWGWDASRNRKPLPPHQTTVPGLIQQLRELAEPGASAEPGSNGFSEAAPAAMDAVSLLGSIELGVARRITYAIRCGHRIERRPTVEDNLRGLVGIAGQMQTSRVRVESYRCTGCDRARRSGDLEHWAPCHLCIPTVQYELRAELRSWQWQAEIIAEWRTPPRELPAPCLACDARGTLLAYADPDNPRARCVGCGKQWSQEPQGDEGAIGILAAHVIAYGRRAEDARRASRSRAVADRQRREGRPAAA